MVHMTCQSNKHSLITEALGMPAKMCDIKCKLSCHGNRSSQSVELGSYVPSSYICKMEATEQLPISTNQC